MNRPEGFALVLVLWVLSLLTIMAGSFALSMRREAGIVAGSSKNAQAAAVAESGLAIAELMLMHPDPLQRWRTDGSIYQLDYAEAKVRVRLLAETGKVDLNRADQPLLQALMGHAPVAEQLQTQWVNAILDWRDNDDLTHPEGAEQEEYKDAGLNYRPRNKPFQSVEELQLVLGINEQAFKWLENRVTVYSGQAQVDSTQAAKEVLQLLPGVDSGLIDDYLAARRESAINGLPMPTAPLVSNRPAGQTGDNPPLSVGVVTPGSEQNGVITVISEARLEDGATAVIATQIKKSANPASPFQVLNWQRNAAADGSLFTDEKNELLVRQYAEPEFNN